MSKDNKEEVPLESRKITVQLDGTDFQGFSFRILGVVVTSLLLIWLTHLDGTLVFLVMSVLWLIYFSYKIIRYKEEAYQQIIEDLEDKNARLEKSNKLLQNVVKDSLGMHVSTEDKDKK